MKKVLLSLAIAAACTLPSQAVLTTFTYSQTDSATGSGTIAGFVVNDPGGPITFAPTPMTAATVFNPQPGSTPAGFVGAQTAQAGAANEANTAVGLTWSGFVVANGTRGGDNFTIQIPFTFVPKQIQTPTDTNDYNWSVAFGDNQVGGADTSSTSMRFAAWLSRDTVIDGVETSDTFQRYTQQNHTFGAGVQDNFTNFDTTNGTIKDATDGGAPTGVDAAGRNLAFYYGWRDQGALTTGAILIDTFTVGGFLDANPATLVPEPSAGLLALAAAGLLIRRRR